MPDTTFLTSPLAVAALTTFAFVAILAFSLWARTSRGYGPALVSGSMLAGLMSVIGCLVLTNSKATPRAAGGFETVADTVKPTETIDAGAETDDDKQLNELMEAILG